MILAGSGVAVADYTVLHNQALLAVSADYTVVGVVAADYCTTT